MQLIEERRIAEAEVVLLQNIDSIGYAKAVWHLWRFQRYTELESLRLGLFESFCLGCELDASQLRVLYFLQEYKRIGIDVIDSVLRCQETFWCVVCGLGRWARGT